MEISTSCWCPEKQVAHSWNLWRSNLENSCSLSRKFAGRTRKSEYQKFPVGLALKHWEIHRYYRRYSTAVGLDASVSTQPEDHLNDKETSAQDSLEEPFDRPLSTNELKSLIRDSERAKLVKKLSEANQQNRFLKRQLKCREDALANFKGELAVLELEFQGFVKLADEIAKAGIPVRSRKINGKYIQSHLLSRLEAAHEKLKEQIKDVAIEQPKEVEVSWYGMAESVQVMGTFDGWSQGEDLSPEYTGSYSRFSSTLMLRPGRYEIKFMVDGEWQLSSEFPTVGEGWMKNNLLVVE